MDIGLHVKYTVFPYDFNENSIVLDIFSKKALEYQIS